MKSFKHLFLLLFTLAISVPAMAQHWQHPVIKKYGGVVDYKDAALKPEKGQQHKILFHITADNSKEGVNATLWHIARLVNLFGLSDVPPKNVHIVAVVSGPATDLVMSGEAYRKKHGSNNPNLPLMKALSDYGVKIYVCGQAAAEHDIDPRSDLNKYTTLSLSALTDIPYFQKKGYQLMQ